MNVVAVHLHAPFALARSCAEPVLQFDTVDQLAVAVADRLGRRPYHVPVRAWCTAREPIGERAIALSAIDARGERVAFIGYVFGFGHDLAALETALRASAAQQEVA